MTHSRLPTQAGLAVLLSASLAAQTVDVQLTAAPGVAQVAPGVAVNGWLYNGTLPGPTLRITEGQVLRVRFRNDTPEPSLVHWHGQPVELGMDGVPGISRPAVAPGQEFVYELRNLVPGSYWYHPHGHEGQLEVGAAGMLIVDPANPASDPPADVEQTIVLDDWVGTLGGAFTGHLLNGRSSAGQVPIVVQPGQRLRLRVVNVASGRNYVFALDGHPLTVTHADGNRILPVTVQAVPIGIGERWDVIVDCNNPGTWSLAVAAIENRNATLVRGVVQYAGHTGGMPPGSFVPPNLATGTLLSYAQLAAFHPVAPLVSTPDRTWTAALGMSMGPGGMLHTINGQTWPNVPPFAVASDEDAALTFVNQSPQYHPMHVHGHFFRMVGTAGGTVAPPQKDTVLVRPMMQAGSTVAVQMVADNPGRWLLHCHNMEHMEGGMMATIEYAGDADGDGVPDRTDQEPTHALPVVTIAHHAMAFAPGAADAVNVQWTPGLLFALFVAAGELPAPVAVPPLGTLWLDPNTAAFYGAGVLSPAGALALPYVLPANPAIVGSRVAMQGVGLRATGELVLSTFQAMTAR